MIFSHEFEAFRQKEVRNDTFLLLHFLALLNVEADPNMDVQYRMMERIKIMEVRNVTQTSKVYQ